MNYSRIYESIISRARNRDLSGYKEKHHIIPVCVGGTNEKTNLVNLTPEEHFIAHQLLCKMHPDNAKLAYSVYMMTVGNSRVKRNNKAYGWIRRLFSKTLSESLLKNHHNKGKPAPNRGIPHTSETKNKISASRKGKPAHNKGKPGLAGENNPMYGVTSPNKGKKASTITIEKMSVAAKNKQKLECQYCKKVIDPGNFKRYHGQLCKEKNNVYKRI